MNYKASHSLSMEKMEIKIKNLNRKIVSIFIFEILLHIPENKLIIKTSTFFHE